MVANSKKKCYKAAKNAQKYSYICEIVDFNDCHNILLRKNSPPKNCVNFLTIYTQNV